MCLAVQSIRQLIGDTNLKIRNKNKKTNSASSKTGCISRD